MDKQESKKQNKTITLCRDCIFNVNHDNDQIDCSFNHRLTTFRHRDEILEKKREEDGTAYYIINRFCTACRNQEWAKKRSEVDLKKVVEERIELKCDVIIPVFDEHSLSEVIKSAHCFSNTKNIRPINTIIVVKQSYPYLSDLYAELNRISLKYKIISVFSDVEDVLTLVDFGVKKSESQYYLIIEPGKIVKDNLLSTVNTWINYDLLRLSLVEPHNNITGMLVQKHLHQIIKGNRGQTLLEKVEILAQQQKNYNIIKVWP